MVRHVVLPETPRKLDTTQDSDFEGHNLEDEDLATAPVAACALNFVQFVVYSATFQVPAFYFTLHDRRAY
jgi:hypothetical protein